MLTEAVAEVSVTAETAFIGNLDNTLFRLLDKPAGGTIQTQLKDVAGQVSFTYLLPLENAAPTRSFDNWKRSMIV